MFCCYRKIISKISFFFIAFFQLSQDIFSAQHEMDEDKENFCKKRIRVDALSSLNKNSSRAVVQLESPQKLRELEGNLQNIGALIEVKTEFSPPKKKIKQEPFSFEDLQEESLLDGSFSIEELNTQETQGTLGELDRLQAMEVCILSSALHKEMRVNPYSKPHNSRKPLELNYTTFSPDKIKIFENLGGDRDELEEKTYQLKIEFPSPIRNPNYPVGEFYSPAARHAGLPRSLIQQGRDEGIICKLPVDYRIAPFTPETPEEREARKKQQLIDFLEVEKRRGKISEEEIAEILGQKGGRKSKEIIAEIKREIEIWQDYLNYIAMRKKQITGEKGEALDEDEFEDDVEDDGNFLDTVINAGDEAKAGVLAIDYPEKAKKMRKAEIEDAFEKFVAGKLIHLEVEGYDLWFSGEIDLEREDEDGVTNLERMLRGLGPIGPDGEVMNLHHQTHYDFETHKIKSVIVLITEYVHRTYSGGLHFGRDTYQDLPRKKVNRNEWNKVRSLFYKAIAEYFLSLSKQIT